MNIRLAFLIGMIALALTCLAKAWLRHDPGRDASVRDIRRARRRFAASRLVIRQRLYSVPPIHNPCQPSKINLRQKAK